MTTGKEEGAHYLFFSGFAYAVIIYVKSQDNQLEKYWKQ